jgi:hypothetical protein
MACPNWEVAGKAWIMEAKLLKQPVLAKVLVFCHRSFTTIQDDIHVIV